MTTRGSYSFDIGPNDRLVDSSSNLEALRRLFRDGDIIGGNWGPGDEGDFDNGSWHILCHLAGGSGVLKTSYGLAWCGITHMTTKDLYEATISFKRQGALVTVPLAGAEGKAIAQNAQCLGFIEGSSLGHISARGVDDPPEAFNKWPRQQFDQDIASEKDGGVVWEHWSTTRDLRPTSEMGTAILQAYLTLISILGGRFVAAVARGRREHNHPEQLVALVKAGVLTADEATWDILPDPIPEASQKLLYEARPSDALAAAEALLATPGSQRYFMFQRRIQRWNTTAEVRKDLGL